MEHHRRCHCRKVIVFFYTVTMLIFLSAINLNKIEATSKGVQQTNEKQPTTKQPLNQQQKAHNSSSRTRSSSNKPVNRSSSMSLVRLSKLQNSTQFPANSDEQFWAKYKNVPPLFVTHTRDFVVDVAKSYPTKRVTIIQANDGDGDPLEYQLNRAFTQDASPYFTINSTSGELRLSAKQFRYNQINSSSSDQVVAADDGEQEGEQEEGGDVKSDTIKRSKNAAAELSLNRYFLNVAVNDGHFHSTVELNIHVTNSTLMKQRMSEGIGGLGEDTDANYEVEELQKLMRERSREFYDKLNHELPNQQQQQQLSGNSSTVVLPDYVNPGLNIADDLLATTELPATELSSQSSSQVPLDQTSSGVTPTMTTMSLSLVPAPLSPSSSSPRQMMSSAGSSSSNEHLNQTAAPEPMMMNLIMIMCSCLMIALVLLMFIIPLSVKKLRKRLKHVELQHEHLSQKTSNVSSTLGSSQTGTSNHQRHHPSLSQFTLGSDGSTSCTRRDSSMSVFRQSSLDSAVTMSPAHHQFNRVDNGTIENLVYLHQHNWHNHQNHPAPFKHPSGREMMIQQQQMFGLQAPNVAGANENVYYPLSEEFYSTIQTDTTPLGDDDHAQHSIQGFTTNASNHYLMARCGQPDLMASPDGRQLDSPDSAASSPALRSLTRFLSLPARHHSFEEEKAAATAATGGANDTIRQLEMQLGCGPFSTMGPSNNLAQQQQQQHQINARTIARASNIDREQVNGGWELERQRLRIPWVLLDEGQFGQVWRCKLSFGPKQPERLVAVKSLKKNAANSERGRDELLAEIEIMKLVCNHPNVVKLLHCCTSDDKPILLVMEYIEQGKLQSYLKNCRKNHHYSTSPFAAPLVAGNNHDHDHHHHHQLPPPPPPPPNISATISSDYLTSRDLMKFIYHVAKGMEYISSKCIVHRDLASRNILVSGQKICKIGDFGMARHMQSFADVYERRSGNCKVPVRWMAPEVLLSNSFTTKSDVYSFGILMWEIITLGSVPYNHLETEQVIDGVARNGERPERPEYCHPQLYEIMSQCWHPEPAARPCFKNLVDILGELVLSANNYIELDQYPDHDYYNIPSYNIAPDELL